MASKFEPRICASLLSTALIASLLIVGSPNASAAYGDPPGLGAGTFLLRFDELGNGILTTGGATTPLTGTLMADPTGSGIAMALTYLLPEPVISGTVVFAESGVMGPISD